jgi:hypothetical protein
MLNHLVCPGSVVLQDVVLLRARRLDELLGNGLLVCVSLWGFV